VSRATGFICQHWARAGDREKVRSATLCASGHRALDLRRDVGIGADGADRGRAKREGQALPYERAPRRRDFRAAAFSLALGLRLRTLAGRILRMAAFPARWQARHMYQLATVR
jgi:hypothetical protein